jgi:predicted RNase H-like HicB family nuclease/virulence-associated protein VagC
MNLKILMHEADEGGYWAEAPVLPGCVSQGETMDELLANMREAVTAWLEAEMPVPEPESAGRAVQLGVLQVEIVKVGSSRLISPAGHSWDTFFDGPGASDDFMRERTQPEAEARDAL